MASPALLLAGLAALLLVAGVAARLARRLGQPEVVGEIAVGMLVVAPALGVARDRLPAFSVSVEPAWGLIGDLGLTIFMFLVGARVSAGRPADRTGSAVSRGVLWISAGAAACPFLAGLALPVGSGALTQRVFVGLVLAVTACPVLARILESQSYLRRDEGSACLGAAAITDAACWVGFAVLLVVGTGGGHWPVLAVVPLAAALRWGLRPWLQRWLSVGAGEGGGLTVVVVGLLGCAAFTAAVGLQASAGALLFGWSLPQTEVRGLLDLETRLGAAARSMLLPVFFVLAGAAVDLTVVVHSGIAEFVAVLVVAVLAKVLGAAAGARAAGFTGRAPWRIGVAMNTRGATEVILLGLGRQAELVSGPVNSALMIMAVITTAATGPALTCLRGAHASRLGPYGRDGAMSPSGTG